MEPFIPQGERALVARYVRGLIRRVPYTLYVEPRIGDGMFAYGVYPHNAILNDVGTGAANALRVIKNNISAFFNTVEELRKEPINQNYIDHVKRAVTYCANKNNYAFIDENFYNLVELSQYLNDNNVLINSGDNIEGCLSNVERKNLVVISNPDLDENLLEMLEATKAYYILILTNSSDESIPLISSGLEETSSRCLKNFR